VVSYLVTQTNEKANIHNSLAIERTLLSIYAVPQRPVPVTPITGALKAAALVSLAEVPIFNVAAAVVSVKQIGPCDVHEDDKRFGLEAHEGRVEYLDPSESRVL
jgi:hypothetical protein